MPQMVHDYRAEAARKRRLGSLNPWGREEPTTRDEKREIEEQLEKWELLEEESDGEDVIDGWTAR